MPFLTLETFASYVGEELAKALTKDPASFAVAERAAAQLITTETGVEAPDDAADIESLRLEWAAQAAAHIILHARIGTLAGVSQERLAWAATCYRNALATLAQHKVAVPNGRKGATMGPIEGTVTW